jgi:putative inorganic carbon (HCO3(-)) transporter
MLLLGVALCLAWGVGAFGSVYPFAYQPLMMGCAIMGVAGLWIGRRRGSYPRALVLSLIGVGFVVVLQLVPLSHAALTLLSPDGLKLVQARDLATAIGESERHAISIDPRRTMLGLSFFASFAVLLIGVSRALTRQSAATLSATVMMLGVTLALVGIIQQATFNGKVYGFWVLAQGGSPFGPFINRNHFAGWMLMAIPLALGYLAASLARGKRETSTTRDFILWLSTKEASRITLTGFAIATMTLSLVLTFSRSGMIALPMAVAVTTVLWADRQQFARRRSVLLVACLLLFASAVGWAGFNEVFARFQTVDLISVNERPAIWADTVRIARDFWLTGTGLNTYGISTLYYQTAVPGLHLREAHNDYLQLAAEGGLLLGLPIFLAIACFGVEIARRFRADVGSIWWLRIGAVTGLIAIAIQSLVEFSLQMPGNAVLFAVVGAIAIHDGRRDAVALMSA